MGVLSDHLLPAEAAVFVAVQGMRQLTKVDDTNLQFGNIHTAAMALKERQTWVFTLNLCVREDVRCGLVVKQSALCLPLLHPPPHTAPLSSQKSRSPVGTFIFHPPVEIYNLDHRTGDVERRREKQRKECGCLKTDNPFQGFWGGSVVLRCLFVFEKEVALHLLRFLR